MEGTDAGARGGRGRRWVARGRGEGADLPQERRAGGGGNRLGGGRSDVGYNERGWGGTEYRVALTTGGTGGRGQAMRKRASFVLSAAFLVARAKG